MLFVESSRDSSIFPRNDAIEFLPILILRSFLSFFSNPCVTKDQSRDFKMKD